MRSVKHGFIYQVFFAVALFISGGAFAEQMVSAKNNNVKVYESASKSSEVIMTLNKGEQLGAIKRQGMYWVVETKKGNGYVSVFKVKKSQNNSAISEALLDAVKQGREENDAANARARSAVMGVRGLDESSTTASAGDVKPNLRMVYAMEDILVTSSELSMLERSVFSEAERNAGKKGL